MFPGTTESRLCYTEHNINKTVSEKMKHRRNRTIFSNGQLKDLEEVFQRAHYPSTEDREELTKKTCISPDRLQVICFCYIALRYVSLRYVTVPYVTLRCIAK